MARYFIQLRDGDVLLPHDGESQEFANFEAVRREAFQSARQILSEAALAGTAGTLNQQIVCTDEAGKIVLTVPVGHAAGTDTQT